MSDKTKQNCFAIDFDQIGIFLYLKRLYGLKVAKLIQTK
jgi:hypothetical protein